MMVRGYEGGIIVCVRKSSGNLVEMGTSKTAVMYKEA